MNLVQELINNMFQNEELINQLIDIDNEKMNTHLTISNYYTILNNLSSIKNTINPHQNTLFITEGDPTITLNLLIQLSPAYNYIIFINQGYIAMNKWFLNEYQRITGNTNIELDYNINYNNYITLGYKVIPLGEPGLINTILEDFYD